MAEQVPHDHPSVSTFRARLARSGGTRRPCLRLPTELDVEAGAIVRLALDGRQYHARVESDSTGVLIRGAYDNRRLARNPEEGQNRLLAWADDHGLTAGDAVELDAVEAGYLFGVREPGRSAIYEATEQPSQSLSDIARDLDG